MAREQRQYLGQKGGLSVVKVQRNGRVTRLSLLLVVTLSLPARFLWLGFDVPRICLPNGFQVPFQQNQWQGNCPSPVPTAAVWTVDTHSGGTDNVMGRETDRHSEWWPWEEKERTCHWVQFSCRKGSVWHNLFERFGLKRIESVDKNSAAFFWCCWLMRRTMTTWHGEEWGFDSVWTTNNTRQDSIDVFVFW